MVGPLAGSPADGGWVVAAWVGCVGRLVARRIAPGRVQDVTNSLRGRRRGVAEPTSPFGSRLCQASRRRLGSQSVLRTCKHELPRVRLNRGRRPALKPSFGGPFLFRDPHATQPRNPFGEPRFLGEEPRTAPAPDGVAPDGGQAAHRSHHQNGRRRLAGGLARQERRGSRRNRILSACARCAMAPGDVDILRPRHAGEDHFAATPCKAWEPWIKGSLRASLPHPCRLTTVLGVDHPGRKSRGRRLRTYLPSDRAIRFGRANPCNSR